MPLYEYVCPECAHEFEELSTITRRDRRRACPICGKKNVRRKISGFSAHQGTGHHHAAECGSCPEPGRCGMGACGMGGCC